MAFGIGSGPGSLPLWALDLGMTVSMGRITPFAAGAWSSCATGVLATIAARTAVVMKKILYRECMVKGVAE